MLTRPTLPWRLLIGAAATISLASTLSAGSISITAENGHVEVLRTDGSIVSSLNSIEDGTQVQLVAIGDPGYRFTKFTGDFALVDNPSTVTIRGDVAVTANYVEADSINVSVSSQDRHQTIQGFGFTHSGAVGVNDDDEVAGYYVNELGGSSIRMPLPPEVLPETPSVSNITVDRLDVSGYQRSLDYLKTVRQLDPNIRIIWSVWSPPGWMKVNGKTTGTKESYINQDPSNRLRDDRYEHLAKFFVVWTQFLESEGLPVYAIGPQNELRFSQGYDSCLYTGEQFARLVKATGEAFEAAELELPLIFGPEDMSNANVDSRDATGWRHRPYVDELIAPDVASYFDAWATHGYADGVNPDQVGAPSKYVETLERYLQEEYGQSREREFWITEGGTGSHDWPAVLVDGIAPRIHEAIVNADASLFSPWQYLENAQTTHNTVDYDNGQPNPTKKTYGAMHYYKHIRPGAVHLSTTPSFQDDVAIGAFMHDQKKKFVVTFLNQSYNGKTLTFDLDGIDLDEFTEYRTTRDLSHANQGTIDVENGEFTIQLEGRSIVTLVGENATFEEVQVSSWWPGSGMRRASEVVNGEPGIGWFDDGSWPFIFTYGINAGTAGGAWVYVFDDNGADRENFWAYVFSNNEGEEDYYIWGRNSWGFYYQLGANSGWKSFNQ